jgi:hypothetical protein
VIVERATGGGMIMIVWTRVEPDVERLIGRVVTFYRIKLLFNTSIYLYDSLLLCIVAFLHLPGRNQLGKGGLDLSA